MNTEELNHKTTTIMPQKYLETRNTLMTLECNTANKHQHTMIQRIRVASQLNEVDQIKKKPNLHFYRRQKNLQIRRQYTR